MRPVIIIKILLAMLMTSGNYHASSGETTTLSNGLPVIYIRNESSPITVLEILIKGGKNADPAGKDGLAFLTTRLCVEIPDRSKAMRLMNQSSKISMNAQEDFSSILTTSLSDNLDETLKILGEIITKPLFSSFRIDRIRNMMNYMRQQNEDEPSRHSLFLLNSLFFPEIPLELPVYGNEKTLENIKKKDITGFYRSRFTAKNLIFIVSSDMDLKTITQLLEKYFKNIPPGEAISQNSEYFAVLPEERTHTYQKNSKQSFISIAYPLDPITSGSYIMNSLADTLLGNGTASRLWTLREEKKLAYIVRSRLTLSQNGGFIEAYLETSPDKKDTALSEMKNILNDIYKEGISEEEFQTTKTFFKSHLLRSNETKTAFVHQIALYEGLGLGADFHFRLFEKIDQVPLEEFNTYLKKIFNPERALLVMIGPRASLSQQ